ncbi:MAG: glucose-1-phosphate thymidylyltransferase [Elusimicrobia bacterium]|nr:glucose-1-phosphate thymidylyltransferase [Elusimicrobiota bacterium]
MLKPENFFDNNNPYFKHVFKNAEYVWDGLKNISSFLSEELDANIPGLDGEGTLIPKTLKLDNGAVIQAGAYIKGKDVHLGSGTVVESGAYIKSPAFIGKDTEIRQGAYIRGNVIIGDDCVLGHTCEIKNSVMLGGSKAGHFAYIGDSILGRVNLGAGTKLANLKIIRSEVRVKVGEKEYETGLRKFGAVLSDGVETGCNSVTAPGTILSKWVVLYPNTTARGFYREKTIIKLRQNIQTGGMD